MSRDTIFMDANFALPPTVRVSVVGERILIHVGEAPTLFTFSITADIAERLGEDLDDAIDAVVGVNSDFGPPKTFTLVMDDVNRTANLKLVKE